MDIPSRVSVVMTPLEEYKDVCVSFSHNRIRTKKTSFQKLSGLHLMVYINQEYPILQA
jgi:hypothetical protein